jgi:MFS family permease
VYTPGIGDVMSVFHVSSTLAVLPFSVFVLGLGFGPVLAAPLSESHGRKFAYMLSIPLFAIFTLAAGFSQNIWTLIILRFFAGLFGSPPLSVGAGTLADTWRFEERALATALFVLSPFLGPALGCVIFLLYSPWTKMFGY